MGETISVSTMLAEVIESQVKVVDGRRPDVAERWFTPEPRAVNRPTWSDWQHTQHSTAGAAGSQHSQQAEQAQAHAKASHSAEAGANGSSSAPRAWSDDFSSVMVVDYRPKPGAQPAETVTTASSVNGRVDGAAVNRHVNGAAVNGTAMNGLVNGASHSTSSAGLNGVAVNGDSGAAGLGSHTAAPVNGSTPSSTPSSSSSSSSSSPVVEGSRFADWAGVSGALDGSSSSTAHGAPFADWAGDGSAGGQPLFEGVLDKRLTGIEDQLQRIAGLLEMMPKSQQAQQAALHLETDDDDDKSASAV